MDGWGMASGGGGGGGRIAVTCESYTDEGTVTAKGGEAGTFPEAMAGKYILKKKLLFTRYSYLLINFTY